MYKLLSKILKILYTNNKKNNWIKGTPIDFGMAHNTIENER